MLEQLKNLIFNKKQSEEELKIVDQVLHRINNLTYNQAYAVYPWITRSKNYEELKKLPDIIYKLQRENEALKSEVKTYKKYVEDIDFVIDKLIQNIEKRYDMKSQTENTN